MKFDLFAASALTAFAAATPAAAEAPATAATSYVDRASFLAALDTSFTDGYDSADYGAGFQRRDDAAMSAVKGEARYNATAFSNLNFTAGGFYCAGCNGSFTLTFDQTTFGTNLGVYGAAVDYTNEENQEFTAFVTYGDGTTANFALPAALSPAGFFGLTSNSLIYSIAFGGADGATKRVGYFTIDNLTIGSGAVVAAVPEPATWGLMLLGFGLVGAAARRRASVAVAA